MVELMHDLTIDIEKVDGVSVLRFAGKITVGDNADALRDAFSDLHGAGARQFVFNLRQVSFLDSTGLGEIVACHRQAAATGGALSLVAVPAKIADVMKFTRVGIGSFDSEEQALGELRD
jgi:anti-sigma B factor antagonist